MLTRLPQVFATECGDVENHSQTAILLCLGGTVFFVA
jgi:hypothetical protein